QISPIKKLAKKEKILYKQRFHLKLLTLILTPMGGEPVPQTAHAGPGRGKRGKTHKKFSASLESELYNRVKSLPGMFSQHLANSLEAYLAVMEKGRDQE
ncbi:MAG: hypothetical protein WBG50_04785, partial [Desulfomonilaceae bacterium]